MTTYSTFADNNLFRPAEMLYIALDEVHSIKQSETGLAPFTTALTKLFQRP